MGKVPEKQVALLHSELSEIKAPAFTLRLYSLGAFPDRKNPRVIWVGAEQSKALLGLHQSVKNKCSRFFDASRQEYSFVPHITLGRNKNGSTPLQKYLKNHKKIPPISHRVEQFQLVKSRLTPQDAIHTPIKRYPLVD